MTRDHVSEARPLDPLLHLELSDGDRAVGWIRGRQIGFRGFANEVDSGIAAWVAYGTAERRLARGTESGPIPGVVEPLTVTRLEGRERILASGREIATLIRPTADSLSGSDSFGFEIEIPAPADELRMRSMAHLIYRTLRRSGVRWSSPVPGVTHGPTLTVAQQRRAPATLNHGGRIMYNPTPNRRRTDTPIPVTASLPPPTGLPSATAFVARYLLISVAILATIGLIVVAPLTVTVPLGFVFLAGLLGTGVLSALERRRHRGRESHDPESGGGSHPYSAGSAGDGLAGRMPSASGALAVFSISMLGLALLAPVPIGAGIAALGFGGLIILRVLAMFAGWAPRGSAWAKPRRAARADDARAPTALSARAA